MDSSCSSSISLIRVPNSYLIVLYGPYCICCRLSLMPKLCIYRATSHSWSNALELRAASDHPPAPIIMRVFMCLHLLMDDLCEEMEIPKVRAAAARADARVYASLPSFGGLDNQDYYSRGNFIAAQAIAGHEKRARVARDLFSPERLSTTPLESSPSRHVVPNGPSCGLHPCPCPPTHSPLLFNELR